MPRSPRGHGLLIGYHRVEVEEVAVAQRFLARCLLACTVRVRSGAGASVSDGLEAEAEDSNLSAGCLENPGSCIGPLLTRMSRTGPRVATTRCVSPFPALAW